MPRDLIRARSSGIRAAQQQLLDIGYHYQSARGGWEDAGAGGLHDAFGPSSATQVRVPRVAHGPHA